MPHKKSIQINCLVSLFVLFFLLSTFLFGLSNVVAAPQLEIREVADSGLIIVPVDPATFQNQSSGQAVLSEIRLTADGESVAAQFVDLSAGGTSDFVLAVQLTGTQIEKVRSSKSGLLLSAEPIFVSNEKEETNVSLGTKQVVVETDSCRITHDSQVQGGFPCRFEFPSGRVLSTHTWHDRLILFDKSSEKAPYQGSWILSADKEAKLTILSDGPVCTIVRDCVRFVQADKPTPNQAEGVYDWFYFKRADGLAYVRSRYYQRLPVDWEERHFFELHVPDAALSDWQGADRAVQKDKQYSGTFTGDKQQRLYEDWGALTAASPRQGGRAVLDYLAVLGQVSCVYDGLNSYGPYLHVDPNFAWGGWNTRFSENATWLRLGTLGEQTSERQETADAAVPLDFLKSHLAEELTEAAKQTRIGFAVWTQDAKTPRSQKKGNNPRFKEIESSDLAFVLEIIPPVQGSDAGVQLAAIHDKRTGALLSGKPQPLFALKGRDSNNTAVSLDSLNGWNQIDVTQNRSAWELTFTRSGNAFPNGSVKLVFQADPDKSGIRLRYDISSIVNGSKTGEGNGSKTEGGADKRLTIDWLNIGCTNLADQGPGSWALYPFAFGQLIERPCKSLASFGGSYPGGWCVMPWLASWNERNQAGLYIGIHDPCGDGKTPRMVNQPGTNELHCEFSLPGSYPVESGLSQAEVVWQAFSGDWYDAAIIYRDWVRLNADWFPILGRQGRMDTPNWLKQLNVWAQGGGQSDQTPNQMRRFRDAFGVPAAIHWYCWHKIPFDNDYPHYFPAYDGFAEAVANMQKDGDLFVMPYINGRLWDTRDKGLDDWQFNSVALPGVAKNSKGEPVTESYGSKESDGSPVKLGVMCPATSVWQNKVHENVTTLLNQYQVKGVYIDQVAAAAPVSCFDASHGHALGGGPWWVQSYRGMMDRIYGDSPRDRVTTTECNGEAYADQFDAFLTWHVQYDKTVPAFAAVYGGAIQMFGRASQGNDQAMRMKWAQQLVFGEQIGWCSPDVVNNPKTLEFLRPLVRFRSQTVSYFYRGEMARPPKLLDPVPIQTEDWQWNGVRLVTLPVVQTASWRILDYDYGQTPDVLTDKRRKAGHGGDPNSKQRDREAAQDGYRRWETGRVKSVLLAFVNFSDKPVSSKIECKWAELGIDPANADVVIERVDSEGIRTRLAPADLSVPLSFPAGSTWGIEIRSK